ncbi:MAG: hypothetical protein H0V67_01405 [Geodermatophilaceae bacterium]|nr:hypothetical protein [Geodermatophilaceae bacterium]
MSDRIDPPPTTALDSEPVLPRSAEDETGEGWGELPEHPEADEERYLRDRPPHHEE